MSGEQRADSKVEIVAIDPSVTIPTTSSPVTTIADGADVALGTTTDAAVVSDANGTALGKLRGLVKMLADVWDSTNHLLRVSQKAATVPTATTMQNAVAANANGTGLTVTGYATAIINITSSPAMSGGTLVNFEASTDGSEWTAVAAHQIGVPGTLASTTSTDGDYRVSVAGFTSLRARIGTYSAGTVTVKGYLSPLTGPASTVQVAALTTAGVPTSTADQTVDGTGGGVTLLAANANRKSAFIQNTGAANMRVTWDGNAPTATRGAQVGPGQFVKLSMPWCEQGVVKAIREGSASTTAAVVETV